MAIGCDKPDPTPELGDGIFQDLNAQLAATQKMIADATKQLDEHKANVHKAKPQTGQIKFAEKRVWDTEKAIDLLVQQEKYWKIRIAERKKVARIEYLKAFKDGKSWPDPKELEEYKVEKRLRQAKLQWDVRQRISDNKKEAKAAAAPPSASGGQ